MKETLFSAQPLRQNEHPRFLEKSKTKIKKDVGIILALCI